MLQVHPPATVTPEQARAIGDAIAEQGRTLATLNDWRAILFIALLFLIVVTAILFAVIIALLRANRQERAEIAAERMRIWGLADKFGEAADKLTKEVQGAQILNARVESALGRCEAHFQTWDRPDGQRP